MEETSNKNEKSRSWIFTIILLYTLVLVNRYLIETNNFQKNYLEENNILEKDFFINLCETKKICEQYKLATKVCATAGSISECVRIKTENAPNYFCTEDGKIKYIEEKIMPTSTQCFIRNNMFVKIK